MGTKTATVSDLRPQQAAHAIELRAASFTLPMMRLLHPALDRIEAELLPKVQQAPEFFLHAPVVIDLTGLSDPDEPVDFPRLVGLMRGLDMLPVGVRGGGVANREAARAMELAILGESSGRSAKRIPDKGAESPATPAADESAKPATPAAEGTPTLTSTLVDQPVRSGQRIYAAGGDLTVTATVSSGSELMADGNIHIYAPLRGRVIAGLKGNTRARIFCQALHAELVSVAGHYRVSENIPANLKGQPVQIFLEREILRIEPL